MNETFDPPDRLGTDFLCAACKERQWDRGCSVSGMSDSPDSYYAYRLCRECLQAGWIPPMVRTPRRERAPPEPTKNRDLDSWISRWLTRHRERGLA